MGMMLAAAWILLRAMWRLGSLTGAPPRVDPDLPPSRRPTGSPGGIAQPS
jgi:hypothetical protein